MKKATHAFIDASNIIYGTRDEGWRMDFRKLHKYLEERYECKKIYYFGGRDEKNEKQAKFYKIKEKFSRMIMLSGDGDFEILLKYFLEQKKEVVVIANGSQTAKEIRRLIGERFTELGSLRKLLEKKTA